MIGPRDDPSAPVPEAAVLVERLQQEFAPPPLEGARRAALDAALADRIARRRPGRLAVPVLAGATVGALLAWLLLPAQVGPAAPEARVPAAFVAQAASAAEWEDELLDAMSYGELEEQDGIDELPDDYTAIAAVFLDG
jgi:hypothetical protein